MKSIEERAKAYAEQYEERYQVAMFKAFLDGAKEQKAIDIDEACKWVDDNVGTMTAIAFRKAMEDKK